VIALSFMACLLMKPKGFARDGRRRLSPKLTRYNVICSLLHESADQEAKLVEGHMRVAYSVPKHRQYLRGRTPSEPVLAEAAARIMAL